MPLRKIKGADELIWGGVIRVQPKSLDVAWLAGFFDGEGHIAMRKTGNDTHVLHVVLTQKNPEVLHWVQANFGGNLYQASDVEGAYRLYWYNKPGAVLFRMMLPYLRVKRICGLEAVCAFYRTRSHRQWPPKRTANRRGADRTLAGYKVLSDHHALEGTGE